jgi:hypothetical protein
MLTDNEVRAAIYGGVTPLLRALKEFGAPMVDKATAELLGESFLGCMHSSPKFRKELFEDMGLKELGEKYEIDLLANAQCVDKLTERVLDATIDAPLGVFVCSEKLKKGLFANLGLGLLGLFDHHHRSIFLNRSLGLAKHGELSLPEDLVQEVSDWCLENELGGVK